MHRTARLSPLAVSLCAGVALANPFATQPKADEVFYHFMPIAWRDADPDPDGFGDFLGMTDSLPYLDDLGVTALWMNPIFPSPAYHGYQHGRADEVNTRFGTEQQFLDFVSAARVRDMEVYLDLVVYGISQNSAWHQSAFNNPSSPYDGWLAFTNPQNTQYTGYTFSTWDGATVGFTHWDLRDPQASALVIDWSRKWLDPDNDGDPSDGIHGYRLDHVWVNYSTGPDGWGYNLSTFWSDWYDALRAVNPDVFTFCEQADWGSHGAEFLSEFGGAMTKPFEFAARDAVRDASAAPLYAQMEQTITALGASGHSGEGTFVAIIGDHDVDRLASAIGADTPATIGKAKAAGAVLLLQPFPPIIYHGDEIAMVGTKQNYGSDANDIPMREPFKWNAQNDTAPMTRYHTRNFFATANRFSQSNDGRSVEEQSGVAGSVLETHRTLIAQRHANVALRRGDYHAIDSDRTDVWAFLRSYEAGEAPIADPDQAIAVAINLSDQPVMVSLDLTAFMTGAQTLAPIDLATGSSLPALTGSNAGAYPVTVPAYGFALIEAPFSRPAGPRIVLDGQLDPAYMEVASNGAFALYAALDGDRLYLATQPAQPGADRFILTASSPFGTENAPWAKAGSIANYDAYVGNEADNGWTGWFDAASGQGPVNGAWLEASLDLRAQYGALPTTIFLASVAYETPNDGALIPAMQVPPGDGDADVSFTEFVPVDLADLMPPACSADFDADGDVDLGDFGTFGAAFGSATGDLNYNPDADLDNDGDVDLGDFGSFGASFGRNDC
ncbi:MAG: hypothetical protein Tsb0013_00920 [Phycisphaerales bacterium]